ncbi:MerR family transcriptional regulator [Paenibacillus agricola]|uniref:MerR family transcriptional regulator n=1 Tax=Paenibacillus agricola TaxID=2716264 RepID=A0ABX0J3W9_9BACL|nr:MerR family transcriptional regulator [Paenibacillus agricola]
MRPYLRNYELVVRLNIKRGTLTHWIKYFQEFLPIDKQGDVKCYGYEAINVLLRIKTLREQLYSKPSIREILINEGYPIFTKNPDNS